VLRPTAALQMLADRDRHDIDGGEVSHTANDAWAHLELDNAIEFRYRSAVG
jgi:hypothetical protein